MMPGDNPTSSLRRIAVAVGSGTLLGLLAITIVPPGSTRVFSAPWSLVYAATLIGPAVMLVLRAFDFSRPLALPSAAWQLVAIGAAGVVLASAVASPHRPIVLRWSAPYLSAIAVFLMTCDLVATNATARRHAHGPAWRLFAAYFLIVGLASLTEWTMEAGHSTLAHMAHVRNPFPLGHSNYTAGLAVLMLPMFGVLAVRGRMPGDQSPLTSPRNLGRAVGAAGVVLALVLLLTSASRAAVIAVGVMTILGLLVSSLPRAAKVRVLLAAVIGLAALISVHPRTRAMFMPADPDLPPNISNVQRTAMLEAGRRMGMERPLLGWGAGSTPLVFPHYRASVDGGAENVLQLHSLPIQLWSELGLAGLAVAALAVILAVRNWRHESIAAVTLAGYAAFALFDAQLDVPAFGWSVAFLLGLLAGPGATTARRAPAVAGGILALGAMAMVFLAGGSDPTPRLNSEALSTSVGRNDSALAVRLLTTSLALNPDQEIAHFNLGWLTLVSAPAEAAKHFEAAARLVPDKGGVYFGLGLARLNGGDTNGAARALALELLNDPVFVLSPWWRTPQLAALRPAALAELERMEDELARVVGDTTWTGRELRYVRSLNAWLAGTGSVDAVRAAANTAARRAYFRDHPDAEAIRNLPTRTLKRERIGYPVLMRNLNIPPPVDIWVVQESTARSSAFAELWPDKGWLPSPLLISLLERQPILLH